MTRGRKRIMSVLLAALLSVLSMAGCASEQADIAGKNTAPPEEGIVLRLLTEDLTSVYSYSTVRMVEQLIKQFEKDHQNVEILLEELPTDPEARTLRLDQLKVEIMAGKGPDMYLLNAEYMIEYLMLEPLFEDVNQAMHNGRFADVSAYYDADSDLKKEGLNSAIMDAGVLDGHRFVLPIRFDLPVAYVNRAAFDAAGLDTAVFDQGITGLLDAIVQLGDEAIAYSADYVAPQYSLCFFPELLDYENQQVLLTQDALADYIDSWIALNRITQAYTQQMMENGTRVHTDFTYERFDRGETWLQLGEVIRVQSISESLYLGAAAKAAGVELEMYPLTGSDGKSVAEITQYAAVDAHSQHPELAYAFLRQFLTEEVQWETILKDGTEGHTTFPGYPVRTEGSAAVYYSCLHNRAMSSGLPSSMPDTIEDEDVPILQTPVDVARFPVSMLEWDLGSDISFGIQTPIPEDFDPDGVAADFVQKLEFHLLEG